VKHEPIENAKTELAVSPPGSSVPGLIELDLVSLCDESFAERYEPLSKLGEGGMGEVRLFRDRRIGREIALKVARPELAERPEVRARLLREARVQGQLEHPAVVPVYDLGVDPQGELFFTMQPLRGRTLEQLLVALREGEPDQRFSARKLLEKLAGVCLAIDFVHQRGVVHRDLKPANIMLGNFGEAYVLDWGLAKFSHADELDRSTPSFDSPQGDTFRTQLGDIYGTPGYMAPEQLAGKSVDARADVYALGVIVHQLLVASYPDEKEIPPELEAACRKATAEDPEERFASARDLAEAVDRYLDGDRDQELRRTLALERSERASDKLALALSDSAEAEQARTEALREVAGALALDPHNEHARHTLLRLLVEPPARMPHEAQLELERATQGHDRVAALGAITPYLGSALLYAVLIAWMGVRDVVWAGVTLAGFLVAAFLSWLDSKDTGTRYEIAVLAASFVGILGMSRMFGPFVLVPTFALGNTLGFALTPRKKRRLAFIAVGCLSFVLPALLERFDLLSSSYRISGGVITVLPQMHDFPPFASAVSLVVITIVSMIGAALFVGGTRDALAEAERRLHLHAWQLKRMLPDIAEPRR
jgi:serine/threonine-protein kinase